MQRYYLAILGVLALLSFVAPARAEDAAFASWLQSFKEKASAQGIRDQLLEDAFAGMEPDEEVVRLDGKQPENKITFDRYIENTLSQRRIDHGRQMMREHRALLTKVSRTYGVQPNYIVALWAIESDFGRNKGNFSVLQSLATLAYEGRRAEFFAGELLAALKIIQNEHIAPGELTGSWAGAMGDCQFMPSTYLRYAADGDHNGTRDIWNSTPDVFASIAHYLQSLNWDAKQPWGRAVVVPDDFRTEEADLKRGQTASYWRKRGLAYGSSGENHNDGGPIPESETVLYAMYPRTTGGDAFLVTENFQALLKWNRSRYFATAVGMLADAIGDGNDL